MNANLSIFSNNIGRDAVLKNPWLVFCVIKKFFLYCCKKLTPIKTTKSLQDILKASDPTNPNGLCLRWWALMNMSFSNLSNFYSKSCIELEGTSTPSVGIFISFLKSK